MKLIFAKNERQQEQLQPWKKKKSFEF